MLILCRFIQYLFSQEIDREERLQNDLFCVGLDAKPQLNQSLTYVSLFSGTGSWNWRLSVTLRPVGMATGQRRDIGRVDGSRTSL